MSETPAEDAFEQSRDTTPPPGPPTGMTETPVDANEADAAEQAVAVPIDEDEYR